MMIGCPFSLSLPFFLRSDRSPFGGANGTGKEAFLRITKNGKKQGLMMIGLSLLPSLSLRPPFLPFPLSLPHAGKTVKGCAGTAGREKKRLEWKSNKKSTLGAGLLDNRLLRVMFYSPLPLGEGLGVRGFTCAFTGTTRSLPDPEVRQD
jgi:hypothetical protein